MEENQAHAYYVNLKNKGSGAAMFKEGLGFDKAGPGYVLPASAKLLTHVTGC